jgi:hypothetical protein
MLPAARVSVVGATDELRVPFVIPEEEPVRVT